jgi:hypothetical protein
MNDQDHSLSNERGPMNDQDHSLSLSDPDRSLVLSHLLVNFLKNLVSCQTSFTQNFLDISKYVLFDLQPTKLVIFF